MMALRLLRAGPSPDVARRGASALFSAAASESYSTRGDGCESAESRGEKMAAGAAAQPEGAPAWSWPPRWPWTAKPQASGDVFSPLQMKQFETILDRRLRPMEESIRGLVGSDRNSALAVEEQAGRLLLRAVEEWSAGCGLRVVPLYLPCGGKDQTDVFVLPSGPAATESDCPPMLIFEGAPGRGQLVAVLALEAKKRVWEAMLDEVAPRECVIEGWIGCALLAPEDGPARTSSQPAVTNFLLAVAELSAATYRLATRRLAAQIAVEKEGGSAAASAEEDSDSEKELEPSSDKEQDASGSKLESSSVKLSRKRQRLRGRVANAQQLLKRDVQAAEAALASEAAAAAQLATGAGAAAATWQVCLAPPGLILLKNYFLKPYFFRGQKSTQRLNGIVEVAFLNANHSAISSTHPPFLIRSILQAVEDYDRKYRQSPAAALAATSLPPVMRLRLSPSFLRQVKIRAGHFPPPDCYQNK